MQTNWKRGLLLTLVTAVMWALLPIALKGILDKMDPITITWYRFWGSALIATLWYGRKSLAGMKNLLSKKHRLLTLTAVAGLLSNYLLFLFGLDYVNAGAAEIVIQLAPLLLLLGSVFIFKENFSRLQWGGVVAFTAGMFFFFHLRLGAEEGSSTERYVSGIAIIVLAAIFWALYGLAQKQLIQFESSNTFLLIIYLAGTFVYLPFSSPLQVMALDSTEIGLLVFCSLNTIVAYGCFGQALSLWEGSRVSATITLAPLLTLVFLVLLNLWTPGMVEEEPMDLLSWIGGFMVVLGSIVAALGKSTAKVEDDLATETKPLKVQS